MLLTVSGDEFCGPVSALFQAVAYHLPTVSPSAFLVFVTESSCGDHLLASPPFSGVLTASTPSAVCSFSVSCLLFSFVGEGGRGSVCPWGYAGLSQGWLWECHMMFICSPVGLLDVSQAGLEPVSGSMGALLFS
jgi:hypothetical protein